MKRARLWLLAHIPAGIIARPAEWFLAFLCIVSGIPILTDTAQPEPIAALLPSIVYYVWGACLTLGGVGMICGISSYRRSPDGWTILRVSCYRLGFRLLGMASALYAVVILVAVGWDAVFQAFITMAFSLMCAIRLLTLGRDR